MFNHGIIWIIGLVLHLHFDLADKAISFYYLLSYFWHLCGTQLETKPLSDIVIFDLSCLSFVVQFMLNLCSNINDIIDEVKSNVHKQAYQYRCQIDLVKEQLFQFTVKEIVNIMS